MLVAFTLIEVFMSLYAIAFNISLYLLGAIMGAVSFRSVFCAMYLNNIKNFSLILFSVSCMERSEIVVSIFLRLRFIYLTLSSKLIRTI